MKLNPWIHFTLLGFSVFNLVIGLTLFFWYPKVPFSIISPVIPQSVWATIFVMTGIVMLWGLLWGLYSLLRYMMIFGLFMKLMWEIGFLFRLTTGGTILSVELWGMIAYLQLLGVIFFDPRQHERT